MKEELFQIFKTQSKTLAVGPDMLVDFAYKTLCAKFPENSIAEAIGEHYKQCEEICLMKIEKAKELLTMKLKDIPKGRQITLQAPFLHGYAYGEIAHRYCRQNTYQASCLYIKSVSTEEGFTRGVMIHLASDAKVTPMPNGSFFIDMVN